jgi:hypothetical protein
VRIAAAHLPNVMGENVAAGGCRGHALEHSDDRPRYDSPRSIVEYAVLHLTRGRFAAT